MTSWAVIVGGAGYFGRILAEDLLRYTDCGVVVAARRGEQARAVTSELDAWAPGRVRSVAADLDDPASLERALEGAFAAVCAAGPFHRLPLSLLDACLARRVHYLDLSDDRGFTARCVERGRGGESIAVCSGWSAAPGLTAVLARRAIRGFGRVERIDAQIAPGNRAPRNEGTVASLLHSAGRPLTLWSEGAWRETTGWSEPRRFRFPPPVGERTGYLVDVPDDEIFPPLFGARSTSFRAGAELAPLNWGMSALARVARAGLVADWSRWSAPLRAAMAATASFGHDWGAVGVEAEGIRADQRTVVRACLTAAHEGQRIPALPASVTIAALASGRLRPGPMSVDGWIRFEELSSECARRGWSLTVEEGS